MEVTNVWTVLDSLLTGAVAAGTVRSYSVVGRDGDGDGEPIAVRVHYRESASADTENMDAEIQSFGYGRVSVDGRTREYEIPLERGADAIPAMVGGSIAAAVRASNTRILPDRGWLRDR